jgi:hypothetical protein
VDQAQPSYSWKNRQAQVFKSRVSGENFLPLPGGFKPEAGSTPRGGQVPRITDVAVPETISLEAREGGSFLDAPPTQESFFRGGAAPERSGVISRSQAADKRRGLGL